MKKRVPKPRRLPRKATSLVALHTVDRVLADYPDVLRRIADDIEHFAIAYGAREQRRR